MKRVEADAVDELGEAFDIPDGEVGGLADFERSRLAKKAKCAGALAGGTGDALAEAWSETADEGGNRGADCAVAPGFAQSVNVLPDTATRNPWRPSGVETTVTVASLVMPVGRISTTHRRAAETAPWLTNTMSL